MTDSKGESAGAAVGKGGLETGRVPSMEGEVRVEHEDLRCCRGHASGPGGQGRAR